MPRSLSLEYHGGIVSDDRREKRREQILRCARDVFAEKGYLAATVEDIVDRVQVARGTFYLYFADKRAIYEALVDRFFHDIDERVRRIDLELPETPVEQLRENILRAVQLALDEPSMMKIVLYDATGLDPDFDVKLRGFWNAVRALIELSLKDGQERGMVRDGDRAVMAAMAMGAIKEVLLASVVHGEVERTASDLTDEIMRFLGNGVLTFPV
jgi:AcrR family transcriptional regulator